MPPLPPGPRRERRDRGAAGAETGGQGAVHRHVGDLSASDRPQRDGRLRRVSDPVFGGRARARRGHYRRRAGPGRNHYSRWRKGRASAEKRAGIQWQQRCEQAQLDDLLEGMSPMEFTLRFTSAIRNSTRRSSARSTRRICMRISMPCKKARCRPISMPKRKPGWQRRGRFPAKQKEA